MDFTTVWVILLMNSDITHLLERHRRHEQTSQQMDQQQDQPRGRLRPPAPLNEGLPKPEAGTAAAETAKLVLPNIFPKLLEYMDGEYSVVRCSICQDTLSR